MYGDLPFANPIVDCAGRDTQFLRDISFAEKFPMQNDTGLACDSFSLE